MPGSTIQWGPLIEARANKYGDCRLKEDDREAKHGFMSSDVEMKALLKKRKTKLDLER